MTRLTRRIRVAVRGHTGATVDNVVLSLYIPSTLEVQYQISVVDLDVRAAMEVVRWPVQQGLEPQQ
jgi:hypothetical protein